MAKKSPYETGELSDSIFLILLATLEPVHGYRIMQGVEESTDGAVKIGPATMYTTLKKLKAAGRGGRGEAWLDTGCAAGWPSCRSTTWRCSRT